MSRNLVAAARIYLVASRMDVDLTMNAMRLAYKSSYYEDILDAIVSARELPSKIAAGPDVLWHLCDHLVMQSKTCSFDRTTLP